MPSRESIRAAGSVWMPLALGAGLGADGLRDRGRAGDRDAEAASVPRPARSERGFRWIPTPVPAGAAPSEPETVPNAPTHLGVGLRSTRRVEILWVDRSEVEDGYRIERRLADSSEDWVEVGTVGPVTDLAGRFVDGPGLVFGSGPQSGRRYCYRVTPFNELGSPEVVPVQCVRLNVDLKKTNLDELVTSPGNRHGWHRYAIPNLKEFDEAVLVFANGGAACPSSARWGQRARRSSSPASGRGASSCTSPTRRCSTCRTSSRSSCRGTSR